jgi:hypothetical protein
MTRQEALAYRARWIALREVELRELRETPPQRKLRQLAALHAAAVALRWNTADPSGEDAVRERWNRLRARSARG